MIPYMYNLLLKVTDIMQINVLNTVLFDSIYFVKKVNGQDSDRVTYIITALRKQVLNANLSLDNKIVELSNIDYINNRTLLVAIGGDGTMLHACSIAAPVDAFVIGVNVGSVGFLTDFHAEEIIGYNYLWQILMGGCKTKFPMEDRIMLSVVPNTGPSFTTMNEVSIANKYSDSIIDYDVMIDGNDAGVHRANSVIVSTPTGSTAYALSSGGSIMYPSLKALEIIPVAPLTMTSRPIIVGGRSEIQITARVRDGGSISARGDGRLLGDYTTTCSCESISFMISVYPKLVRLIHTPGWNFFDVLTNKLGWNR